MSERPVSPTPFAPGSPEEAPGEVFLFAFLIPFDDIRVTESKGKVVLSC